MTAEARKETKLMIINAKKAFTNLQSVEKYPLCGWSPKYLVANARHDPVPSRSQSPVKVAQAAKNRISRAAETVKNKAPPKNIGRMVMPA